MYCIVERDIDTIFEVHGPFAYAVEAFVYLKNVLQPAYIEENQKSFKDPIEFVPHGDSGIYTEQGQTTWDLIEMKPWTR